MARRFSDLEKRAIAILANGGNPATSNDTALANYWQWKINPSSNDHDLPTASTRTTGRKRDPVFINPFSLVLPANVIAEVSISQRSNTNASAGIKAACGVEAAVTGTTTGLRIKNLTPARVYWRTGAAETSSARTSRITKQPYKTFFAAADEGYSVPFGRVGTNSVYERQVAIRTAIGTAIELITFSPEKYRG